MCIMYIYMNICMIPSPAHETPPSNGLGPPGIPLYLVFCWYFVALGISTYAMHMLKSNSLPTTYSYIPTCIHTYIHIYIYTYIYIHNPLHIPDKPSCYILCLYTTYRLSTCYIFTLCAIYKKPIYTIYIYNLYTIYILSRGYLCILSIYYLYATYILSYIYITYLVLCYVFCMLNIIYIYIYIIHHFTVYTYTYLVSFTILCQYSPHTPDRTHPQGAGGGGGRENGTTYTDLYTCCICNHVYVYIYI